MDGYTFTLTFSSPPTSKEAVMGEVMVTKAGQAVTTLEPVMGAYAHIVAFPEDYHTIWHVHPMGAEPAHVTDRGGPKLEFHFEAEKAGFVKVFVQVRINNKDIYAPFGVLVKA